MGGLNPKWNQESSDLVRNTLFKDAMMLTQKEFLDKIVGLYEGKFDILIFFFFFLSFSFCFKKTR